MDDDAARLEGDIAGRFLELDDEGTCTTGGEEAMVAFPSWVMSHVSGAMALAVGQDVFSRRLGRYVLESGWVDSL